MNEVNTEISERSRKNLSVILQAMNRVGQVRVAQTLEVSESTVSRMKDADLPRLSEVLASCGLKVVPVDYKCAKPELIAAALVFARAHLETIEHNDSLLFSD